MLELLELLELAWQAVQECAHGGPVSSRNHAASQPTENFLRLRRAQVVAPSGEKNFALGGGRKKSCTVVDKSAIGAPGQLDPASLGLVPLCFDADPLSSHRCSGAAVASVAARAAAGAAVAGAAAAGAAAAVATAVGW